MNRSLVVMLLGAVLSSACITAGSQDLYVAQAKQSANGKMAKNAGGINVQPIASSSSDHVYRSKCIKGSGADQYNIFKLTADEKQLEGNINSEHIVLSFQEEFLNMAQTIRSYSYANDDYDVTVSVDKNKEAEADHEATGLPSKIKIVSKKTKKKKTINAFLYRSGESNLRSFCKK